jgi:SPP1 family phage portal protein
MKDYYDGKHDILTEYKQLAKRSNQKIICNYVQKIVDQEVSYAVGQDLSYLSKSADNSIIETIDYSFAHFDKKHDQKVLLEAEIYGESYELFYINKDMEFCSRVLNPTNAFLLRNEAGEVELFFHFWSKKFSNEQFIDAYDSEKITHYKLEGDQLIFLGEKGHIWNSVPVGVCSIENTVFDKIKSKNDSYNLVLSDNVNIISDFRSAYLVFTGVDVGDEEAKKIHELGIILLPNEGKAEFLLQQVNDQYIQNMLNTLEADIHKMANSIDFNEKMQSNLSGTALRSRILSMEMRVQLVADSLINCVTTRLKYLFYYLKIKENKSLDYKDINIKYTPNTPSDIVSLADAVSKLRGLFSDDTLISLFSFGENSASEIKKRRKEQAEETFIDLDKLKVGDGDGDNE